MQIRNNLIRLKLKRFEIKRFKKLQNKKPADRAGLLLIVRNYFAALRFDKALEREETFLAAVF